MNNKPERAESQQQIETFISRYALPLLGTMCYRFIPLGKPPPDYSMRDTRKVADEATKLFATGKAEVELLICEGQGYLTCREHPNQSIFA